MLSALHLAFPKVAPLPHKSCEKGMAAIAATPDVAVAGGRQTLAAVGRRDLRGLTPRRDFRKIG
jgi:hypothetical protein